MWFVSFSHMHVLVRPRPLLYAYVEVESGGLMIAFKSKEPRFAASTNVS
jgi:hypothetical protein